MIVASVIVPAHGAEATLPRTLERLCAQDAPFDFEVVVIDNGSHDRTAEIATRAGGPVRLVHKEPGGPGASRNLGVARTTGSAIAFCDSDCFPADGWLAAGVRALEQAELVQGKVLPDPDGLPIGPFDRSLWIPHEVGLWETANLFVTREIFDRVGGFDDWLTPEGERPIGEDVWFGWQAKRLGARSAFCEQALSHHAVFPQRAGPFVAERRRLRYFPAMTQRMPELRRQFLYRRWFLNRRTAALDAALCAVSAATLLRCLWLLAGALPYARLVLGRARPFGRRAVAVAVVDAAADLVGAQALVRGSLRYRAPVL